MCTVSFVASNNKFIITSNRDEKVIRPAIEPKSYILNNKNITFPKDPKAGGTWFAVSENGTVLVLLNGGSDKHEVKQHYKRSRGLIVLDLISSNQTVLEFWKTINLDQIEPFTLVLFLNNELYQLRWNEIDKECIKLDESKSYIWSSSTLYSREIREKRSNWFDTFLQTKPNISPSEMYNFHRYTEIENQENGLIINRNDVMQTLSITQSVIEDTNFILKYCDLQTKEEFTKSFSTI